MSGLIRSDTFAAKAASLMSGFDVDRSTPITIVRGGLTGTGGGGFAVAFD